MNNLASCLIFILLTFILPTKIGWTIGASPTSEVLVVRDNAMMMSSPHPTFAPADVDGFVIVITYSSFSYCK